MDIPLFSEYLEKINGDTLLIIRNDAGNTIILDEKDEVNIRGNEYIEIKTEFGDILHHKDGIIAVQTVKKSDFIEQSLKQMLDLAEKKLLEDD